MGKSLLNLTASINLSGGALSSSERYTSKTDATENYSGRNDDCDCHNGDCSDCYCVDCN